MKLIHNSPEAFLLKRFSLLLLWNMALVKYKCLLLLLLFLVIFYFFPVPAEISTVFAPTLVNLGDTATLECTARANPINLPSLIAWSRIDGYDMKRVVTSVYDVGASRLVITGAVKGDSGVFMCTASNGIGKPALAYAKLIVRCTCRHIEIYIQSISFLYISRFFP